jgi:diguanylate cyclase (GGDEF)-like protein
MSVDSFTLFAANAVILLVTALAFFAAWQGQRHEVYWASWIAANTTLATALILFLLAPGGRDGLPMVLANCLLVAGFGLRWRAARQFGRRSSPLTPILVPTLFIAALFALPSLFDYGVVYTSINIVLAAQAFAVAYEFWRDRLDGLPSRYGLVLAYSAMAASFGARAGQGLLLNDGLTSYLPQDSLLQIHLLVALFFTTASGAFVLSIAYERGAMRLTEAALQDPLTGIHNRRAFEIRLQELLVTGGGDHFAVVIFDIDRFKRINDRYGHAAGDAALRACAETCVRTLRPSDFVARIGGEEFAAILPNISAASAFDVTDRVRRAVGACEIRCHGSRFRLTLSAGIVHSSTGAGTMDELMKRADAGLYRAKSSGRNKIEQFAA